MANYIWVTVAGSGTGSENTTKPIPADGIVAITGGSTSTVITYTQQADTSVHQIMTLTHAAVGAAVPTFIALIVNAVQAVQKRPGSIVEIDVSTFGVTDCIQSTA